MLFRILDFKGEIPKLNPRLLPDNCAQIARNTRLEDGTITPVRNPRLAHTFGSAMQSIYLHDGAWFGWNADVSAAEAPIAEDRFYYTGDGAPKMWNAGTIYGLALVAPTAAPTLLALSAPNASLLESVIYVYTNVTGFGEESAPSPASVKLSWSPGVVVRLSAFTAAPAGRNVTHRRIYRSQTSAAGVTTLFFVAEIPVATATYDHDAAAVPLSNAITVQDFNPPRATLKGLTAMPNGIMAAFDGKDLLFSEPYQPHAWPEKYSLTVDYPIVGLVAFGSVLAVLTTGTPYVCQGTHPETMVLDKRDKSLPCLSRRAIVDIGYAAYYPSSEGLAMISATDAQIVSRGLFTTRQWRALSPETFIADSYDGRYVFTHTYSQFDTYDGGNNPAALAADTLDFGNVGMPLPGFVGYDFGSPNSAFGEQRTGFIDMTGQQPSFIDADVLLPEAMFSDPASGKLYMLTENGTQIVQWDDDGATYATQIWRSKRAVLAHATSFGAILIQTDEPASSGNVVICRIFADGAEVDTITTSNAPERVTSGYMAAVWEVEIESNMPVTAVALASTMEELIPA